MTSRIRRATTAALLLAANAAHAAADLAVTQMADRLTVQPGVSGLDLVNFSVTLTNGGPDPADVLVTSRLPTGLRIPAGTSVVTSTGTYNDVSGVWDVGVLAPDDSATLLIPAQALPGAMGCLVNAATAALVSGADPDPDNDSARAAVGAPACADLVVSSVRSSDAGVSCLDVDHTIRVTNDGPTAATSVRLIVTRYEITAPANFSERSCTGGDVVVPPPTTIDLGSIAPGETKAFVTGLRNLQRAGPDITVAFAVNATASEPDPDAANSREAGSYAISRSLPFGATNGTTCFISTVLGDSPFRDLLPALRRFRDRYLMTWQAGRVFVEWYYAVSPAAAGYVARHDALRKGMIAALAPVAWAARYPAASGALSLALALVIVMAGVSTRARSRARAASSARPAS